MRKIWKQTFFCLQCCWTHLEPELLNSTRKNYIHFIKVSACNIIDTRTIVVFKRSKGSNLQTHGTDIYMLEHLKYVFGVFHNLKMVTVFFIWRIAAMCTVSKTLCISVFPPLLERNLWCWSSMCNKLSRSINIAYCPTQSLPWYPSALHGVLKILHNVLTYLKNNAKYILNLFISDFLLNSTWSN